MKKHMYLSKEIHACYKPQPPAQCFPVTDELDLKVILPANQTFKGGEKIILFQTGLFS
jgi:hypothetical protein